MWQFVDISTGLDMFTLFLEVLGSAGVVETIAEFTYAIASLDSCTSFERIFSTVSGTAELLGELSALGCMVQTMTQTTNANDALGVAKNYIQHPIHIYACLPWVEEEGHDRDLERAAVWVLGLTMLPTLF